MTADLPNTVSPFPLLAHGPGWWAVDKPPGISVHNDPGNDVLSWMADWLGTGAIHAVHRLDAGTSGVVLLADAATIASLSKVFSDKATIKTYIALVHGSPKPGRDPNGWGRWTWPLAKGAGGRKDPIGRGKKQAAETRYRVAFTGSRYSLLLCRPVTGRTHQIRRHARKAGCTIIGDHRYGTPRAARTLNTIYGWKRLGLHAAAVALPIPGEKTPVTICSVGLPLEFKRIVDSDLAE